MQRVDISSIVQRAEESADLQRQAWSDVSRHAFALERELEEARSRIQGLLARDRELTAANRDLAAAAKVNDLAATEASAGATGDLTG